MNTMNPYRQRLQLNSNVLTGFSACAFNLTAAITAAALFLPAPAAHADNTAPAITAPDMADSDVSEFSELLEVMSQETEIATKTRMNSDFVPGIVTVLDGDKLAALGARTVVDAMSFVPGVQSFVDPRGAPSTMVRGIPFPFNNGQIQILLNGVPVQRDSAGISGSSLYIPIAQVDRIEFVRGPGSVLYGEFSQQGLLNIVTRNDGAAVGADADSRDSTGVHARHGEQYGDWHIATNISAQDSGEALLQGTQKAAETRRFGVVSLKNGGLTFNGQGFERETEDDNNAAPPNLNTSDETWSVDAGYAHAFGNSLNLQLRSQYLTSAFANDRNDFEGTQLRSSAELIWRGWQRQSWLAGIDFSDGEFDSAHYTPPAPPGPPPPMVAIAPHERTVLGIYLQNQIELTDRVQLTLAARSDDNSEVGERITPRTALAWHFATHHVVKVQYAEGYRGPTYFELYSSAVTPVLDFEVNKTTELNYVFQKPEMTARATLFHTQMDDMIFRAPPTFGNISNAQSDGVELEWSQQLMSTLRTDFNVSVIDAEHDRTPAPLTTVTVNAAPTWLGNVALLWTPVQNTLFGLHLNHVGPRHDAPAGSKDYDMLNVTFTRQNLFLHGLDLRAGVNNALNETVVQFNMSPAGNVPVTFDFRTTWLSLNWRLP